MKTLLLIAVLLTLTGCAVRFSAEINYPSSHSDSHSYDNSKPSH